MATTQSAALDRKKLMGDPILVTTIVVLITFLTLFILYPLAILLVDSFVGDGGFSLDVFRRIFDMPTFTRAITNTLKVGFLVGILSTLVGLLFAYVEVYVRMDKFVGGLFKVVSMLPVVSPPFVLSLSMIMLFGKAGIITRFLLGIYDNSVYGFWGIAIVQTLTFFPVCYMMLKGLLKNIDPSLEEAARDMGASRWKVFTSVTLPLMLPGLGNAFLVTFIESIADFANPMIIGGSYDTLATTIYLQITGAYDKAGAAAMAVVLLCITLAMFAVQKYYLEGSLDVAEIVQSVEDTQNVDAVLDGQLYKLLHHIIVVVLVAKQVLAPEQHLQAGVGHSLAERAQALPGILVQVAQAAVKGGAAPALDGIVPGLIHSGQDALHIGKRHTGSHQGLVGITKDGGRYC